MSDIQFENLDVDVFIKWANDVINSNWTYYNAYNSNCRYFSFSTEEDELAFRIKFGLCM